MYIRNKPINLPATPLKIEPKEIYILGHPDVNVLTEYVLETLDENYEANSFFRLYKALICFVGGLQYSELMRLSAAGIFARNPYGCTVSVSDIRVPEFTEFLYQKLVHSSPTYVIIDRLDEIIFPDNAERAEICHQIEILFSDLRKLANEFDTPIIVTGKFAPAIDSDSKDQLLSVVFNEKELNIKVDNYSNIEIQGGIGLFKLSQGDVVTCR
jgi:hypothetical protein